MSGHEEDQGDGSFHLLSTLKDHTDGKLTCPSQVEHVLQFRNYQLCDLRVAFSAQPEDGLLRYRGTSPWADDLVVHGSSKPRRHRRGSRTRTLIVEPLAQGPQHRDLTVNADLQAVGPAGALQGPKQRGWHVFHQLTLDN